MDVLGVGASELTDRPRWRTCWGTVARAVRARLVEKRRAHHLEDRGDGRRRRSCDRGLRFQSFFYFHSQKDENSLELVHTQTTNGRNIDAVRNIGTLSKTLITNLESLDILVVVLRLP